MSSIPSYSVYHVDMDGLEFGEWLEDQYLSKGLNQKQFAELIGRSNKTVSGWVNEVSKPRDSADYDRIGEILKVDPNEVRRRAGRKPVSERNNGMLAKRPPLYVVTPEPIGGNVRRGQTEYRLPILGAVPADSNRETAPYLGATLPVLGDDIAGMVDPVVFIATGECLLRRGIQPGDRIIVERDKGTVPTPGQIVVVRTHDGYTMKEWSKEGNDIVLRASEPGYAPIRLKITDEGDGWDMVGVVKFRYGLDRL